MTYHLVVEHVPDLETWDWVVWRKGAPSDAARQGSARTSANGKAQAEAVLRGWEEAADRRDDGGD
jgi:hypothetical protein